MIYLEDASKEQLLTIALHEDCELDLKYAACRELQLRKWNDEMLTDLVILYGKGYTIFDIAIELGVDENTVIWQLRKHGLRGKRKWKQGEDRFAKEIIGL